MHVKQIAFLSSLITKEGKLFYSNSLFSQTFSLHLQPPTVTYDSHSFCGRPLLTI